jgi:putative phage-type endonuclease
MIVLDHDQGTEEWFAARLGVPSASNFAKLVTSTGKPSASAEDYINQLIAERMTGERAEIYTNSHMERGTLLEPEARSYYEFVAGKDVQEVGFCLHDTICAGCSPDGLVGDYGLEIKCPSASVQVSYLRDGKLPVQYKQQVMGCMWITGAELWDFLSYHPDMPSLLITVERDQNYIDLLALEVEKAADEIEKQTQRLLKMRSKP